jgi:hypothetical protein
MLPDKAVALIDFRSSIYVYLIRIAPDSAVGINSGYEMLVRLPRRAMTARPRILFLLAMIAIFTGCNKSYDEKIGGVWRYRYRAG